MNKFEAEREAPFEALALPDLKQLLRETMSVAIPNDKDFIHRLCNEIIRREK